MATTDSPVREVVRERYAAAGLVDIESTETHRVHAKAASAIVRARKPAT